MREPLTLEVIAFKVGRTLNVVVSDPNACMGGTDAKHACNDRMA